ncbi:MAG: ATP-binding cassette domain-containing protein, partial [Oscillospiraceae bacterium]
MLLSLSGVGKTFGAERIFSDITITVEPGERIALIGPNGAGKTTLLDLIAGVTQPDEGIISAQPGIRVGYLRQNGGLEAMGTIESEMRAALGDIYALEQDMMVIYEQMALVTDHQCDNYRALEAEHQRLDDLYASRDGYQADVKINRVLTGMGFGAFDRTALVTTLSGGERTRLRLCKLLVEQPELLILDEATNHLDFAMLSWLEDYLSSYHGAVLTVSHDRYFLDRVTRITWELEGLAVVRYPAPYSGYLTLRSERLARLEKEYERHHQEEARLLDYAERNMARASTAASAKSRLRQIARMGEAERPPMILKPPLIRFTTRLRPVSQVLSVEGLTLTVGEGEEQRVLLRDFDLLL